MRELIILYGKLSSEHNGKQQKMIDGGCTCGYRSYAEKFGSIVYLSPQEVKLSWEKSIYKPKNIINYVHSKPKSLVWVLKHDPIRDQKVIRHIKNKKLYYSCNANNITNKYCDINLVDTPKRLKKGKKTKLFFKGKDPNFWKPLTENQKIFDYLLIGRRADKNEIYFIKSLTNKIKHKRKILWIGGQKHKNKFKTHHEVLCTPFSGPDVVASLIPKAKVGILYTEHPAEGFPQSFLEMTMCGVPIVYSNSGPINQFYMFKENCVRTKKKILVDTAENLLKTRNPKACREISITNYSLDKSYQRMLNL